MKEKITSIRMTEKTKEQLKDFGEFGETYEDIIKKLMEKYVEEQEQNED